MLERLAARCLERGLPPPVYWQTHFDTILITGPTASGKSSLSLQLGELFPAANIAMDSALVYRGMDIGTAKPSAAEQAQMPHYGMDLIDPAQRYSVAQFLNDAQNGINQARIAGRLPLVVGGTMMYANALYHGLNALPEGNAAVRAALEAKAAKLGWAALHAELIQCDPVTAAKLAPNDAQRIERALEVFYVTQKPLSQWLAESAPSTPLMQQGRWLHISIEPAREVIWHRVANRFEAMLNAGFLEEVAALKAGGDLNPDLPSIRCVGYRQAWSYLNGDYDYNTFKEKGVIATRQLAKRQMTWLRSMVQRVII